MKEPRVTVGATALLALTLCAACRSSDHSAVPSAPPSSALPTAAAPASRVSAPAPTPPLSATAVSPPTPAHALAVVLAMHPGVRASSGLITGSTGVLAALAYMRDGEPVVTVYRFADRFVPVTTLPLNPHTEVLAVSTATAHRLTGSADPDIAVTTYGASAALTAIASDIGGAWHLLTFTGAGPTPIAQTELQGVTFRDPVLFSTYPDCTPNCADGGELTDAFAYSPATGNTEPDPAAHD